RFARDWSSDVCSSDLEHAWLGDESDHLAGIGTALSIYNGLANPTAPFDSLLNPALGAFFYRTDVGYGAVNTSDIALRWNYGLNRSEERRVGKEWRFRR